MNNARNGTVGILRKRILREVDKKDLAMSLKVADEKLRDKIFGNMSERARELLDRALVGVGGGHAGAGLVLPPAAH